MVRKLMIQQTYKRVDETKIASHSSRSRRLGEVCLVSVYLNFTLHCQFYLNKMVSIFGHWTYGLEKEEISLLIFF